MQYLLQIYPPTDEFEGLSEDEQNAVLGEYLAIRQSPAVMGGEQLQPVETATTVRVQNGQTLLTDGPFVDALLPGPDATLAGPTFEDWLDSAS